MTNRYYDWTPVPAATGTIVRPQDLPPYNPPPAVFGQSLEPHSGSGHPPAPAPATEPLSFISCTPSSGSTTEGFTITVTGTGFTDALNFVVATALDGSNSSFPDEQVIVNDTTLIATWDPGSFYAAPMAFFLGGFIGGPPVIYSANKEFTNTP